MRNIEITTEVFSKIWSLRQEGEETENEILLRVLAQRDRVRESRSVLTKGEKEEAMQEFSSGKVLWRDDIVDALRRLGGEADLAEIYQMVVNIRRGAGRSLPVSTDAVIRREVENNSSDSESFTAQRDLFRSVNGIGGGRWALR